MSRHFKTARPDGRTNTEVILAAVHDTEPGHLFTYGDLSVLLSWPGRVYSVQGVQTAVRGAANLVARREARVFRNVAGVGYRVAKANEHVSVALVRRERADVQLRKGLMILRHVRYDEMNENERKSHEGHLLITQGLYLNQQALYRRQARIDRVVQGISDRLDALERSKPTSS